MTRDTCDLLLDVLLLGAIILICSLACSSPPDTTPNTTYRGEE